MKLPALTLPALALLASLAAATGAPRPASPARAAPLALQEDEDLEPYLERLRAELARTYEELAAWCQDQRLFLQRDLLLEGLLAVEPDHAAARKRLGYKRKKKDGEWLRSRYRPPKDRAKDEVVEEFAALRAARLADLRDRLMAKLTRGGVDRERRRAEARLYLPLDPSDIYLRRVLGQVAGKDGIWLSADAVATKERRAEIAAILAQHREDMPTLEDWDVGPPASHVNLRWGPGFQTERVKASGTVTEEETRQATEIVHLLGGVLPELLPSPRREVEMIGRGNFWRERDPQPESLGKYTVYLLQGPGETPVLLEGWPSLTPEQRDLYPRLCTAVLDGFNSIGVWEAARVKRLDGLTRQIIGIYLRDEFSVSTRQGWVWEGFGLYLTHLVVGTRLTYFVQPSSYVEGDNTPRLGQRLMLPGVDWLAILVEEMQKPRPPRLVYTLGKDVNAMGIRELLLAYGMAAYLIELHPDKLTRILSSLGGGSDHVRVLEGELSRKLPQIEDDLLVWARAVIRL